jgi:hypothetical protein
MNPVFLIFFRLAVLVCVAEEFGNLVMKRIACQTRGRREGVEEVGGGGEVPASKINPHSCMALKTVRHSCKNVPVYYYIYLCQLRKIFQV